MLIVDSHLDLAYGALQWNRDITVPVAVTLVTRSTRRAAPTVTAVGAGWAAGCSGALEELPARIAMITPNAKTITKPTTIIRVLIEFPLTIPLPGSIGFLRDSDRTAQMPAQVQPGPGSSARRPIPAAY